MGSKRDMQQRVNVAKLSREDLEDQYLRTLEDINILKIHGRKQEEKIKKMATKLIRLVNDRKKLAQSGSGPRTAKEVDLEEIIEKQQESIQQVNKEKDVMKQKLRAANQQLLLQGKRPTAYQNVSSRIDSRVAKNIDPAPDRKFGTRSTGTMSPQQARYGHSLLEEARSVNEGLRQQILALQAQIARNEDENAILRNKLDAANAMHEAEILALRQLESNNEKSTLDGNIELIRVQRQMKEKFNEISVMEARYRELEDNYQRLRAHHEGSLSEAERLRSRLKNEEKRSLMAEASLKQGDQRHNVAQLKVTIKELENEISILKESNERLTHSAFDQEKEMQWRQLERDLRIQIGQLEAAMKADMTDRNDVISKINSERGYSYQLHSQSKKAHNELDRLRHENEELRDRLKIYTLSGDSVDVEELRRALSIIRQRRHAEAQKKRPGFLENVDPKDLESEFSDLQALHVDTVQELDKTREMLLMQHKINKDYQIEVESVTNQMHEMKQEYESKLDRFARLLDARAGRIKKLEKQLHDVAYGTKQYKVDTDRLDMDDSFLDDPVKLERGENLMEINVTKITLSHEASSMLSDRDSSVFVTYAFYDFEIVSTPLRKLSDLLFDFTAQFIVKVDDTFLHYLQKQATIFEFHQALGVNHRTVATCKVRFHELLDRPQGKLRASATLIGLNGVNCGSIDFWVRLKVPMDQAIRLYRERVKALGYLSANTAATKKALETLDAELKLPENEHLNQLLVQILSCNHVQGRQKDVQPNIYCVYKFFDFGDHDTVIIPNTNNPTFDDRQAYPIHMNADLDAYLKSEKLIIYIFDDTDPDMTSYLGKAVIDLIPLAHNKPICAPFELQMTDGEQNGSIEFSARWQLPYKSPSAVIKDGPFLEEESKEIADMAKKPPMTPKQPPHPPQSTSSPKPLQRKAVFPSLYESQSKEAEDPKRKRDSYGAEKDAEKAEQDSGTMELPSHSILRISALQSSDVTPKTEIESTSDHDDGTSSVKHDRYSHKAVHFQDDETQESTSASAKELPGTSKLIAVEESTIIKPEEEKSVALDELFAVVEDISTPTEDVDVPRKIPLVPEIVVVEPVPAPKTLPRTKKLLNSIPYTEEEKDFNSEELHSKDDTFLPEDLEAVEEEESDIEETIDEEIDDEMEDDMDATTMSKLKEAETVEEKSDQDSALELEDDIMEIGQSEVKTKDTPDSPVEAAEQVTDSIRIRINHLTLDPNTSVWEEAEVEQMFVEFDFLGSIEETPDALAKPKEKDEKMVYNFETSLELGAPDHVDKREALSSMLTSGHTSFKLTVVSEPVVDDDEESECTEIGTASVDLNSILKNGRDIINDDVIVKDLREPGAVVGKLNISVEALAVLQMMKRELRARLAESDT